MLRHIHTIRLPIRGGYKSQKSELSIRSLSWLAVPFSILTRTGQEISRREQHIDSPENRMSTERRIDREVLKLTGLYHRL